MHRPNPSRMIHFISTAWFVLSGVFLMVIGLVRSGKSWWVIVSLSGYSVFIVFLLISLYLFAIFRGLARSEKTTAEHPLISSAFYSFFYDISPFLGALAGSLAAIGSRQISHYFLLIGAGSLWTTFVVWIIIDPLAGLFEMALPSSRRHRRERLLEVRRMRENERLAKERLFLEVEAQEQAERKLWTRALEPFALQLVNLATVGDDGVQSETEVVDIGMKAWQLGGIACMCQLYSMAVKHCEQRYQRVNMIDYISIWWNGIGHWRSQWPEGIINLNEKERGLQCVV